MNQFFFIGIIVINISLVIFYRKLTKFINIFDAPDKIRKIHNRKVPLLSFLFILLSFLWLIIIVLSEYNLNYLYNIFKVYTNKQFFIFIFCFLSLILIGLYDDKFTISVSTKAACILFILYMNVAFDSGLQIKEIYSIYFNKNIELDNFSIFFTVFCIFALINAMNMFDGVNIQAIFYYLIIFLYFLIKGLFVDLSLTMVFPLIFILYLNIKNKIFLGDSGIYAVTYIVSYILLKSNNLANKIAAEEIFFIFLIPALEMIRLFIYRLVKNKNPFTADSNHIHHILLKKINFVKYIFLIISLILSKFFIIFFLKEFIFYFYFIIIILYFYLLIKINTVVK